MIWRTEFTEGSSLSLSLSLPLSLSLSLKKAFVLIPKAERLCVDGLRYETLGTLPRIRSISG